MEELSAKEHDRLAGRLLGEQLRMGFGTYRAGIVCVSVFPTVIITAIWSVLLSRAANIAFIYLLISALVVYVAVELLTAIRKIGVLPGHLEKPPGNITPMTDIVDNLRSLGFGALFGRGVLGLTFLAAPLLFPT